MSFDKFKSHVEVGDTVILYLSFSSMYAITVQEFVKNKKGNLVENIFQTSYGALKVMDLVGMAYGRQVQLTRGWAVLLHPSAELWTHTLPHRTQILYTADISLILTELELAPGAVVCEAGTGSGSLSHVIARTIAPSGRLFTFDFHEQRAATARAEFVAHGLAPLVTCTHRDVCSDGFGVDHVADAVFLDLPRPWDALPFAVKAMKTSGGRVCSFSPCVQQTERVCAALRQLHLVDIVTVECVQREFQARRLALPVFPATAASSVSLPPQDNKSGDMSHDALCESSRTVLTALPLTRMTGHTGFLTFATLPPCHGPPAPALPSTSTATHPSSVTASAAAAAPTAPTAANGATAAAPTAGPLGAPTAAVAAISPSV